MFDPDYDVFIQIAEAGSISAAARARGQSTAALSKRLVKLEERLGIRLLHRTTRRLELTPAGQELCDVLLPLRSTLQAAEDRISGRNALCKGPLRITAPTSFGRMHIVPSLAAFIARYPDIELTIDLSDEFVDLPGSSYDVAIRIGSHISNDLQGHRLATSKRVLCASPHYISTFGEPAALADLSRHSLLAARSQMPWKLDGPEGTVAYKGTSAIMTNSSEVVRELALSGCGIALRSLWDVSSSLATGELRRILPQYEGSGDVGIYALYLPARITPAPVRAFIEHCDGLRLVFADSK